MLKAETEWPGEGTVYSFLPVLAFPGRGTDRPGPKGPSVKVIPLNKGKKRGNSLVTAMSALSLTERKRGSHESPVPIPSLPAGCVAGLAGRAFPALPGHETDPLPNRSAWCPRCFSPPEIPASTRSEWGLQPAIGCRTGTEHAFEGTREGMHAGVTVVVGDRFHGRGIVAEQLGGRRAQAQSEDV